MSSRLGALWHVWWSPVRFFRARYALSPQWTLALAPVACYVAIAAATALVVARKGQAAITPALAQLGIEQQMPPAVGEFIGVVSVTTASLTVFALSAVAVVALDLLFAQSGQARRLVEFTGLAYSVQLPWAVVGLVAAIAWWHPEPLHLPMYTDTAELPRVLEEYSEAIASSPLLSSLRLVETYFAAWVIALQGTALRIVSGFTVGGAWGAGVLLATLFVAVPLWVGA